jgi:ABC-type multidrug transport system fused ATPase/permease subunit
MKTDNSKSTVLVILTGFLVLYFIFSWQWAIIVSLITGIIGIISPYLSRKIEWGWMKLSKLLGYIVPNIILSVVFYLFLFPISVLYRVFNKDPLMLSNKYDTYFIDVKRETDKKSFEKLW